MSWHIAEEEVSLYLLRTRSVSCTCVAVCKGPKFSATETPTTAVDSRFVLSPNHDPALDFSVHTVTDVAYTTRSKR